MKDCMIDLETWGRRPNAPVATIGAVLFDITTGRIGNTFYRQIDIEDAFRFGVPDGGTVKWWLGQSDAARADVVAGSTSLIDALRDLADFVPRGGRVWGNGPTFDITILDYAYKRIFDKDAPWKFWDVRDCRTMRQLGEAIGWKLPAIGGTAHNALDDAKHQAAWVSEVYRLLIGRVDDMDGMRADSTAPSADFDDM